MYTDCDYRYWNLKDSAADSKLKLLKEGEVFGEEKPGGEKRIHIGSSANKSNFDAFFFPNGEKTVLFEFSKSDLLLYLIDAQDEFMQPKQSYRLDISKLYDHLLKETMSIKDDTLYVRFETNIDKRYYLARPKGDEYYANYNYISHICLPYVTDIVFIRAKDEEGKYHFFLKPKFINKTADKVVSQVDEDNPYTGPTIQKIYYGCPGTGKSYKVMKETEGEDGKKTIYFDKYGVYVPDIEAIEDKSEHTTNIFRTTFHPDYDYSTFVGSYKPVMNPVLDEEGNETDKEELGYEFVPQVFTNAYVRAWKSLNDDTIPNEKKHVYLIIEEINRGNCAQIFGDLFQLLDRRKDGRSEYFIVPDAELRKYLAKQNLESNKLILPENLHILATMNTSDQSLFPMDSAFKRRWAMEYIPVNLEHEIAKGFTFKVNDKEYSWVKFLAKVNPLIRKATDSEDKQMGEFFIKGKISEDDFKNKVMFYIWNDVCKDLYSASRISPLYFIRSEAGEDPKHVFTFAELFGAGRYEKDEDKYSTPTELLEGFITKQLELKAIENTQE